MERALLADCFDRIVCATDSAEIEAVVTAAGFDCVMTGECATGSDRVAEAAKLNLPCSAMSRKTSRNTPTAG